MATTKKTRSLLNVIMVVLAVAVVAAGVAFVVLVRGAPNSLTKNVTIKVKK